MMGLVVRCVERQLRGTGNAEAHPHAVHRHLGPAGRAGRPVLDPPKHAFLEAFNSALEQYDGDESRAFAVAHTAAQNAPRQEPDDD
jgi:hypothetical protein